MGLNNFKKEIQKQVVEPALATQTGLKSGTILNATYETSLDLSKYNSGGGAIIDVIFYDPDNVQSATMKRIPMIKIPGVSTSLPPVGSTAIIAFINNDASRPICIGIITNMTTNEYTKDHLSPTPPPKNMSK